MLPLHPLDLLLRLLLSNSPELSGRAEALLLVQLRRQVRIPSPCVIIVITHWLHNRPLTSNKDSRALPTEHYDEIQEDLVHVFMAPNGADQPRATTDRPQRCCIPRHCGSEMQAAMMASFVVFLRFKRMMAMQAAMQAAMMAMW